MMIALAISGLHAHDLQTHKTDGTIITIPLNTIESNTFIESEGDFVCGISTITDIDDNIYNTVLIGDQCWMKENLKTTQYRNGTPIEYPAADNNAWKNNTSGTYAWYDNDISLKDSHGALYNWHAGVNANGLCPTGWHVPTDAEWMQLVDYVVAQGFPNSNVTNGAGNALKSCRQVSSPLSGDCNTTEHPRWEKDAISGYDHHGFDKFGFSGLPGGTRRFDGYFHFIGNYGYWWSSTEHDNYYAWYSFLDYDWGDAGRYYYSKSDGFSVRCIKD